MRCIYCLGEHSFVSHALSFSHSSQRLGSFGSFSPALSQLVHGDGVLSRVFGVLGICGPIIVCCFLEF